MLRAGWGIYYDSSLSIATDVVNGGPFSFAQYGSAMHAPFPMLLSYGFTPDLRLPSVRQWSGTVEHMFGDHQLVSAVYEGSVVPFSLFLCLFQSSIVGFNPQSPYSIFLA